MRVIWTPEAEQDRFVIWDYIAADNPSAAVNLDRLFSESARRLELNPLLGKKGRVAGTRELVVHERYYLLYEIDNDTVWVLAVMHTSQQF